MRIMKLYPTSIACDIGDTPVIEAASGKMTLKLYKHNVAACSASSVFNSTFRLQQLFDREPSKAEFKMPAAC